MTDRMQTLDAPARIGDEGPSATLERWLEGRGVTTTVPHPRTPLVAQAKAESQARPLWAAALFGRA